ncbi:uncharacterized protein ASPGLDRAFT_729458 [Aspergillus glaucus CBS 516.65]|uniref:F-box domain-containing protein n=1 Tax=Aspergillus glaucus CBS 516.65 TaxID=1160497 RepID=A0A1L9VXN3_ASPGL|nr:hypothetical protein ASPGLDRAFT_729458 [Aspergillus glaucus CBS 516.65]OJJ88666.1 hypothetical protein ASPGLDRAFT_729458 [Aspergillus glaucus CBS 516.65]
MTKSTNRVAWIQEILVQISTHTNTCTLLTSAQRVCHHWHDLIQNTDDLLTSVYAETSDMLAAPIDQLDLEPPAYPERTTYCRMR